MMWELAVMEDCIVWMTPVELTGTVKGYSDVIVANGIVAIEVISEDSVTGGLWLQTPVDKAPEHDGGNTPYIEK